VIGRTAQHAFELELADLERERVDLRCGIAERRLVVLGSGELEIVTSIGEIFFDSFDDGDFAFEVGAFAEDALGAPLIVPKARRERLLVQLFEFLFELSDVKDTSAGYRNAVGGRPACLGLRLTWRVGSIRFRGQMLGPLAALLNMSIVEGTQWPPYPSRFETLRFAQSILPGSLFCLGCLSSRGSICRAER
jgi:hypothetical protein